MHLVFPINQETGRYNNVPRCVCVCVCVRAFIPDVAYFLTDVAYFSPDMASFLMWRSMPYQNSIQMTHMVCKPQKCHFLEVSHNGCMPQQLNLCHSQ